MRVILPQIAQIAQRNTAELYYFAEKDSLFKIKAVLLFWGFVCDYLRDLRETLGFSLCGLFEYSYVDILPQITQITQRNTASCIITQRKTGCLRLRLFWGLSA